MRVKITLTRVLIAAVVALALGMAFAWSGLFNIAASSGHWAITSWFLHYTMRQSVETHAMGIEAPALDDPALVHRGAGHFASGCAPCHGAPGVAQSPVALEMTPHPPYLPPRIGQWEPAELFWIVQHGVKFTGMPAWVALERKDEIWSVVAFLLQLPEMDAATYRRLAVGEASSPDAPAGLDALADPFDAVLAECARCHGRDGAGRGVGAFPKLYGQSEPYLFATLAAYAEGQRHSGIMQPQAAVLDKPEMQRLAAHYAAADPSPAEPADTPPSAMLELGELIARHGVPEDGIPACAACHASRQTDRYPFYPSLDEQTAEYLASQLHLFKQGVRGGTPYAHIMETIAARMSDTQIDAVASYFSAR
jgi:cytochrome c553